MSSILLLLIGLFLAVHHTSSLGHLFVSRNDGQLDEAAALDRFSMRLAT